MRFRNTFILAGISIILLAYVVVFEFILKERKEEAEREAKKVFHFKEDGVKRIIINKANEEIVLEKVGADSWRILKPINYEADPTTVRGLITTMHNMEIKQEIPVEDESPVVYGFDNPQGRLKVDTETDSFSFTVGKKSPVSYQLYIMREGEKKVILTEAGLDNHLRKTVTDFRERKVVKIKRDDVQSISFSYKNSYTVVEKRGDGWWITIPLNVKASDEEMNRILNTIDGLRADTFVDDDPKDLKKFGLSPAICSTGILLKEKGLVELMIGSEDKDKKGRFAKLSTVPSVYLVRKSIIDDLGKTTEDLREKRIVKFDLSDVLKFEIVKKEASVVFERTEDDNWKVNGEKGKKYEIESLIRKVRDAKAKSFLKADTKTLKMSGLDSPSLHIKISLKDSKEPIEVNIGNEKDKNVYAMGEDKEWIVTLDREILESLNKDPSQFKEKEEKKTEEKK